MNYSLRTQHYKAFTLIELMVSMAVTIILVLFVNSIFATAGGAIRQGVATSSLVGSTTIVTKQISDDARSMVGPRDGGFLVILNKRLKNVRLTPADPDPDEVTGAAREGLPDLRVDQIAWVSNRGNLQPLTPGGIAGDPTGNFSNASHVRIWYGHCLKTEPDGKTPSDKELGKDEPNDMGINFVLGRQALFLDGTVAKGTADPDRQAKIYAANARSNASITGDGLGTSSPGSQLYYGLTDIAAQSLDDIRREFAEASSSGISQMTQLATEFIFARERLHVNTQPDASLGLQNWQFAQMHGAFVNHVSEVEISFAGDYENNDGFIDMESYTVEATEAGERSQQFSRIKWYDFENKPTGGNVSENEILGGKGWAFVPGKNNWPHMVRFRFRAHDIRGQLAGADRLPGAIYEVIIKVKR